ncbi:hypothetical protein [Agrobacterium tumefaciens]|uniref:hypothetical protein n=1 Tax=Agrobacterium tumefaciens TaxID=358 RepID=UPI0021CEFFFC|nr:hypothetical protein [Agrobacterium tumefaciens]UXS05574.1 hypothetical protein FY156_29050 [Agrobacterium tumefaciens]
MKIARKDTRQLAQTMVNASLQIPICAPSVPASVTVHQYIVIENVSLWKTPRVRRKQILFIMTFNRATASRGGSGLISMTVKNTEEWREMSEFIF